MSSNEDTLNKFSDALEKYASSSIDLSRLNPSFISLKTKANITPKFVSFVDNEDDAIVEFLKKHNIKSLALKPVPLPLKFDSIDHEINYWCLKNLLDFGSGFQIYFKESVGRAILFGLVNLIIQGNELTAQDMLQLDEFAISQTFRIEMTREVPHETIAAVKVDKDLPTKKFVEMIRVVLHDAARKILEFQCEDFAEFLRLHLKRSKDIGTIMKLLSTEFKGFKDDYSIKIGNRIENVEINAKVQSLIKELHANIGEKDELFSFSDLDLLTVSVSGVIPSILERLNLIKFSDDMKKKINEKIRLKSGSQQEFELRRISLEVTEKIVKASNGAFRGIDLDYYLYKLVKALQKDDIDALPIPLCQDTFAY